MADMGESEERNSAYRRLYATVARKAQFQLNLPHKSARELAYRIIHARARRRMGRHSLSQLDLTELAELCQWADRIDLRYLNGVDLQR